MPGAHDQPSGTLARPSESPADAGGAAGAALPAGAGDPLSDVLRTVRLRGALFFLVDASSPWCVDIPRAQDFARIILPGAGHVVSYHIVVEGSGIASVPGADPVAIEAGDIIVYPHADPYVMASAPGVPPEFDADQSIAFFRDLSAGRVPFVVREGGGRPPAAKFICGFLGCDTAPFNPLLDALPRLLHIRRAARDADLLDRLIDLAIAEMRTPRAGGASIRLGLSELMFVELLRRHLETQAAGASGREIGGQENAGTGIGAGGASGWLAGLRDPVAGRALGLLHADPARDWTLEALAREAGVSRSVLAERFAARVGAPPMRYLTLWRMQLAARRLSDGGGKVAAIGQSVGFRSEAAFSRTFKKVTGLSPAAWRRANAAASTSAEQPG